MSFNVYIPARFQSSRLPKKLLLEAAGVSILERVYRNACDSGAGRVVIATDSETIATVCKSFGATVTMTAATHESGTDRIAQAASLNNESPEQIIVNVQGDEPLLPPEVIQQVAELLASDTSAHIATVSEKFSPTDRSDDPNICKVVTDCHGRALYFSRAPIPFSREVEERQEGADAMRRHVGIYAYRVSFLTKFVSLPSSTLEKIEKLEQLRALENGYNIAVADGVRDCGFGIDTEDDFKRFCKLIESKCDQNG